MKKLCTLLLSFVLITTFVSCVKSNKTIIRLQHIEENVSVLKTVADYQNAIEKYENRINRIESENENNGLWCKILGTKFLDKKVYGKALDCFSRAIEFYPDNQNLYYYRGVCAGYMSHTALDYEATGKKTKQMQYLKTAEESYLNALSIQPDHKRSLFAIGYLYAMELGYPEKAIGYLEKYLADVTDDKDAMLILASCYEQTFDSQRAAELYERSVSVTKTPEKKFGLKESREARMVRYLEEGVSNPTTKEEYAAAIKQLDEKATDVQLAAVQTGTWYKIIGTRYWDNKKLEKNEQYSEALKYFRKSLEYDPDNEILYYNVAICTGILSHLVDPSETDKKMFYLKTCEEAYKNALAINPKYTRALYGIAVVYDMEYSQPEMAIPHLEKLITIETKNIDAMVLLAQCYYETLQFDRAIELYDRIIETSNIEKRKELAQQTKEQVLRAKEEYSK
ncbi:MAG: tetratricopeptide repeat protein [Treponema sp.]|uniref:tetratricopeptide repeat protein n=1 Tax=Treponema sp. TaxID=166 RepID=UPI00298D84EA|nr:tetratricopeptide repeat protein [Treponema sp.]MCR5386505.1 tetratricopeptide repeat protein [Treponema sp.]